jgi:hypothetical protein
MHRFFKTVDVSKNACNQTRVPIRTLPANIINELHTFWRLRRIPATVFFAALFAFTYILTRGSLRIEPGAMRTERSTDQTRATQHSANQLPKVTAFTSSPPVLIDRSKFTDGQLEFAGAKITIPKNALETPTRIQIQRLTNDDLPPLEPGMVNVTMGGGGYRFLPHGTKFLKTY